MADNIRPQRGFLVNASNPETTKPEFESCTQMSCVRPVNSDSQHHEVERSHHPFHEKADRCSSFSPFATRAVAAGVDLPTLSAILGHTSIQMTMRYVHPAEEQKKLAVGKFETFRIAGTLEAMEKGQQATTISPIVQ